MTRRIPLWRIAFGLMIGISHGAVARMYDRPSTGTQGLSTSKHLDNEQETWVQGSIVLATGDTVRCEMSYSPTVEEDLVRVKDGRNLLTLSVKDVKGFFYFDAEKNKARRYYSLPVYDEKASTIREHFLEHVYENSGMAIFSRRVVHLENHVFNPVTQVVPEDLNFLMDVHTGTLRELNEVEAMALMKGKADKVRAYMKTKNMKLKKEVGDYIRVFDYYSSLKRL